MSDEPAHDSSDAPTPGPRRVKRRSPTLIGMAVAKPEPIAPPESAPKPPAKSGERRKPFPSPKKGAGLGSVPKLPPRKLPPRQAQKPAATEPAGEVVSAEPLDASPTQVAPAPASSAGSKINAWSPAAVPTADTGAPPLDAPPPSEGPALSFEDSSTERLVPRLTSGGVALDPRPLESEVTQITEPEDAPAPAAKGRTPMTETPLEELLQQAGDSIPVPSVVVEPEPADPEPLFEELHVESTKIVSPAERSAEAEVYQLDLGSGELVKQGETELDEVPKSNVGLMIAGALGVVLIVGVGVGIGYFLMTPDAPEAVAANPSAVADEAAADEAVADESASAGSMADEAVADEAVADEAVADEAVADEAEALPDDAAADSAAPDDTTDQASPTPAGEQASIAAIEAFELSLPETSPRARRMTEAERRSQSGRFRGRALRAYRAGEFSEAATHYRTALTYNDWDVASVEGMARTMARQGNFPEAIAWAELALRRNPRSAMAYRVLGDVWRQAGHPDRARSTWRRGLRRHRDDRWLRQRLRDLDR